MAKLYLALYLGRKKENPKSELFDNLICFIDKSRYSHCELVINFDPNSKRGVCWSSSPREKAVRKQVITLDHNRWEVYEIDDEYVLDKVEEFFKKEEGKKYDWLGAVSTQLRFIPESVSKWFCSEILAAFFRMYKPNRQTPKDIYEYLKPRLRRVV